jgi:hypothetical protein
MASSVPSISATQPASAAANAPLTFFDNLSQRVSSVVYSRWGVGLVTLTVGIGACYGAAAALSVGAILFSVACAIQKPSLNELDIAALTGDLKRVRYILEGCPKECLFPGMFFHTLSAALICESREKGELVLNYLVQHPALNNWKTSGDNLQYSDLMNNILLHVLRGGNIPAITRILEISADILPQVRNEYLNQYISTVLESENPQIINAFFSHLPLGLFDDVKISKPFLSALEKLSDDNATLATYSWFPEARSSVGEHENPEKFPKTASALTSWRKLFSNLNRAFEAEALRDVQQTFRQISEGRNLPPMLLHRAFNLVSIERFSREAVGEEEREALKQEIQKMILNVWKPHFERDLKFIKDLPINLLNCDSLLSFSSSLPLECHCQWLVQVILEGENFPEGAATTIIDKILASRRIEQRHLFQILDEIFENESGHYTEHVDLLVNQFPSQETFDWLHAHKEEFERSLDASYFSKTYSSMQERLLASASDRKDEKS